MDKSPSLSDYCVDFNHESGLYVTKEGINKRFNETFRQMLLKLVKTLLTNQLSRNGQLKGAGNLFKEIRIMDSTQFKISKSLAEFFPGYGVGREAIAQVQFEYELLSGHTKQLSIGAGTDSDATEGMKEISHIPAGSLLIRDLGYFSPKAFKELVKSKLYFISRAKTQWNFYIKKQEEFQLLTTSDIEALLRKQQHRYLDIQVFVGEQHKVPVRLIANLLTPEQTQQRLKRKKATGVKPGKDMLQGAGLNLFVTNVEADKCTADTIYELYRLRWQVELVFKTWKSIMHLDRIHAMNALRFECVLWIKLLWILLNWSVLMFVQRLTDSELSFHKMSRSMLSCKLGLNMVILQNTQLLKEWLIQLVHISDAHHRKEYKKGSKNDDFFYLTF